MSSGTAYLSAEIRRKGALGMLPRPSTGFGMAQHLQGLNVVCEILEVIKPRTE